MCLVVLKIQYVNICMKIISTLCYTTIYIKDAQSDLRKSLQFYEVLLVFYVQNFF